MTAPIVHQITVRTQGNKELTGGAAWAALTSATKRADRQKGKRS